MQHLPSTLAFLVAFIAPWAAPAETVVEANVLRLEAGDIVAAAKIPEGVYLRSVNDPDDIIWERLPEYRVRMVPAPAVHRSVELRVNYDTPDQDLYVTFAHTSERFYVRLRWRDDTADRQTGRDRFRDGAAVQFSLGDDTTSYLMGTGPDQPVNIWYWSADGHQIQNLAAGGYGSLTRLPIQTVSGDGLYTDNPGDPNEWTVVMSRPLAVRDEYEVALNRAVVPIAFALWQGSEAQRDGLKSVSEGWVLVEPGAIP
ncbi:dimethylsulfide dehydrogenase subunit gamma [Rhodovulum imhoffii]|uniref:Dimethylsulfide dehydrogenase subunit gamma n=1 Tax=Rhodovulum imhoffii TaxID=365340 RepID=A0A2T5BPM4_9RHOB|nr:ethylbenzene dehydrogenase-related protein [Rhodovulum imhoffii]MBK5932868.1 dimethylsulfide dehydrogenase [Rhodovulum imhoffii]PTN00975.1 dimethylsulfide dehydrogenase subunit gamma [Rhodovulum imhoffii]